MKTDGVHSIRIGCLKFTQLSNLTFVALTFKGKILSKFQLYNSRLTNNLDFEFCSIPWMLAVKQRAWCAANPHDVVLNLAVASSL